MKSSDNKLNPLVLATDAAQNVISALRVAESLAARKLNQRTRGPEHQQVPVTHNVSLARLICPSGISVPKAFLFVYVK